MSDKGRVVAREPLSLLPRPKDKNTIKLLSFAIGDCMGCRRPYNLHALTECLVQTFKEIVVRLRFKVFQEHMWIPDPDGLELSAYLPQGKPVVHLCEFPVNNKSMSCALLCFHRQRFS